MLDIRFVLTRSALIFFGCLSYQVIGATNPGQTACDGNGFPTKTACLTVTGGTPSCSYCGGHNSCWIPGGGGSCCPGERNSGKGTCWNPTGILPQVYKTKVCVSNHLSFTSYEYVKVGANGGGLSSGIANGDTRCWNDASALTIYACNSALDGATCVYAATITTKSSAQSVETIKVTGTCGPSLSTETPEIYTTAGLQVTLGTEDECLITLGPNLPY